jgi:hypothetical protein
MINLFFNLGNNKQVFTVNCEWAKLPRALRDMCELAIAPIVPKLYVLKDRRGVTGYDPESVVPIEAVQAWLVQVRKDPSVVQIMQLVAPYAIAAFPVKL